MSRFALLLCAMVLLFSACDMHAPPQEAVGPGPSPEVTLRYPPAAVQAAGKNSDDRTAAVQAYIASVNEQLAASGIAVGQVEWITDAEAAEAGQTVYADDRTKQLGSQWVAGDPRRAADGNNITYLNDRTFAFANAFNPLPEIDGEPAIDASFQTWLQSHCSSLPLVKRADTGANPSALLNIGGPGNPFLADVTTIGFLPGFLFDAVLGAGARRSVIGVTFGFNFLDANGQPTDVNGDGYLDLALKEVWYNDDFAWTNTGSGGVDIESIALHENGHALGLGHFGKISITEKNNKLHVSPRAVMNAAYLGPVRTPLGTDNAAYCGLYDGWPR